MRMLNDKLAESGFASPHRQSPKLSLQDLGTERVAEQAWRLAHLALDAERIEQEPAEVAKARERECRQQDQIFPILVWLTKCDPGLRETVTPPCT